MNSSAEWGWQTLEGRWRKAETECHLFKLSLYRHVLYTNTIKALWNNDSISHCIQQAPFHNGSSQNTFEQKYTESQSSGWRNGSLGKPSRIGDTSLPVFPAERHLTLPYHSCFNCIAPSRAVMLTAQNVGLFLVGLLIVIAMPSS